MLHILFFISTLLLQSFSNAQEVQFTVSLTEQQPPGDATNQNYILLSADLKCELEKCDARVDIQNYAEDFFQVFMNGKLCTGGSCIGSFNRHQTSNITISKPEYHLDIFDFEYETTPNIVVLGCQLGFYVDGICTQISTSDATILDLVCVCATQTTPYCDSQTSHGTCTAGSVKWWQDDTYTTVAPLKSSSLAITTAPILFHEEATISLSEKKTNSQDSKYLLISATLDCDTIKCTYRAVISNYAADYYTIFIEECFQSPCTGSFGPGQNVPVLVSRLNQHIELFNFEFRKISVLGCDSGLLHSNQCLKSQTNPKVDEIWYDDTVCSCQGAVVSCDDQTLIGQCTSGQTTWWMDDLKSTSPILSTSATSAPRNPNVFEFSIRLAEGVEYEPTTQNNITIGAFMNCTDVTCLYTISSFNPGEPYYSMQVNYGACPAGVCQGQFYLGETVRTTLTRKSEVLDLFDLYFDDSIGPNVMVLGCSTGLLEYGECQMLDFYDSQVQLHDVACFCQSKAMTCDGSTSLGACTFPQQPVWWQQSEFSFSMLLSESKPNADPESDKNLSLSTLLQCSQSMCSFQVSIDYFKSDYYKVLVGGERCDPSCSNSFLTPDTIQVTILKGNEFLDLMEFSYNSVKVLGCSQGLLLQDKCTKSSTTNKDGTSTRLCTCEGNLDGCQDSAPDNQCQNGAPKWWQPSPTTIGTTIDPLLQQFSVDFQEKRVILGDSFNLIVTTLIKCADKECDYVFVYTNTVPDYYTLLVNGQECLQTSWSGYLNQKFPTVILSVHRLNEHIDLVRLQYSDDNTVQMFVMECQLHDLHTCWTGVKSNILAQGQNLTDSVCVCGGSAASSGSTCDDHNDQSSCLTWWSADQTSPMTSTSTSPSSTTTFYDVRNQFSMDVSMTESKSSKSKKILAVAQKRHVAVSATMSCDLTSCDYSMQIDNSAKDYFKVFVNNEECPHNTCSGSFPQGKFVNVTVFRGNQHVDLMDFEFTDIPRVAVLGCQDGLVKYGGCVKMTQTSSDEVYEYTDVVCSCRSAELKCEDNQKDGVCTSGTQNWWQNNVMTTTPLIPTTSPIPTTGLKNLSDSGVGLNNVTMILNETLTYSEIGPSLNRTQIYEITKILHNSANLAGISEENAFQILQNMDNVLNAHQEEIRNSQKTEYRLLNILRPMVRNTNGKLIQYLRGVNMGFGAKQVNCKNVNSDDGLIDYGPKVGFEFFNGTSSTTQHNTIIVPTSEICGDQSISHVFFTIYRHRKLFSGPQTYRIFGSDQDQSSDSFENFDSVTLAEQNDSVPIAPPTKCDAQVSLPFQSPVMSATVMSDINLIRALSSDATSPIMARLQFNMGKSPRPLHGQTIVSWFNTGTQQWALEQQCKVISDTDGILTAHCAHLTDFSALIYGQINAEYVCSYPLIILGYVVNAFSIVCLMMLIIIGVLFYLRGPTIKRVLTYIRGQTPVSGDVVNLTYYCSFFLFFILLLFFMNQTDNDDSTNSNGGSTSTSCIVIASISYFSLISALMLSMLIGIRMISHFFTPKLRVFFGVMTSPVCALSIGLIIPFAFTLSIAIFDTNFFKRNDAFCWVRPDFVVYGVIIPIALPIINGLICSSFVIYKMFCQTKRGLDSRETAHHDAEFWSKVFGLIIMQVVMGLPWAIEFIIVGLIGPSPWNYIFVILIGSQGIDLFLIFLYRRHRLLMDAKKWSARRHRFETEESKRTKIRRAETFMSSSFPNNRR